MRFATTVSLVIWICAASPVVAADNPMVVEIWPGKAPEESGGIGPERTRMSPALDRKQVEVTEPTHHATRFKPRTLSKCPSRLASAG